MPTTAWSAPATPMNAAALTPALTAVLQDITPVETLILPGQLNPGTRVRVFANGEYTATSATPTIVVGVYMNQAGTAIGTTQATLMASAANAMSASATSWPWKLQWYGRVLTATQADASASASMYGTGDVWWPTSLTALTDTPYPTTAAARTISQTATGLSTATAQKIMCGMTMSTVTGVTSVTCQEFTCELLG